MTSADRYEGLRKLIQAFSEPYRGTLYHYTSADAVSGILDKHELWMSNTAFMNDTTELKALENAKGILKDHDFTNDTVRQEWRKITVQTQIKEMSQAGYYMASFSRERDSLEQWRAYGNFCIGFDARKLKLALRRRVFLYKCLYTANDIRQWILAKERMPEWACLSSENQKRAAAYNLLHAASIKYKNKHFNTEKEIRLVTTSHHNWVYANSPGVYEDDLPIYFRPHRLYGFVPYLKFFIECGSDNHPQGTKEPEMLMKERKLKEEAAKQRELLPVTEVIVGPMAHQREAKTACEILLSERGYKQVRVTVSDIPYRGI